MPTAPPPQPISLNTAAILTGRSLRTWQRRIEEGLVPRLGDGRALVPFDAVVPELPLPLAPEDVDMLVRADQGDAGAQADIGALFALAALQPAPAGRAAPANRGGGVAALWPPCTFLNRPRSRARPMPCTGWACCTPPGWPATATRWR